MKPRPYRLVIAGAIPDHTAFADLSRQVEDGDTVLSGLVRDGDHLLAILAAVLALDGELLGLQALDL